MNIILKKDKYILEKDGVYMSFTKEQLEELYDLLHIVGLSFPGDTNERT